MKPDHLVGLVNLNLAFMGQCDSPRLEKSAKDLAKEFRDLKVELFEADLPDRLKKILMKRVNQISSALEHFYAFGVERMQEETEALVGALALHPPKKNNLSLYKKLAAATAASLVLLQGVDTAMGSAHSIANAA